MVYCDYELTAGVCERRDGCNASNPFYNLNVIAVSELGASADNRYRTDWDILIMTAQLSADLCCETSES